MKNKEFFYLQYDKLNWQNQEKTKINSYVNDYIINNIISKNKCSGIKLFDVGFGIGFFFKMLIKSLGRSYNSVVLRGCEPSAKNYNYFRSKFSLRKKGVDLKVGRETFLDTKTSSGFDFVTSIYTFTAFVFEELEKSAKKIHSMLNQDGKFVMVVADESYLSRKLNVKKDLSIEKNIVKYKGKKYEEVLHYSEIPLIGTVIDYNREEKFYIDLFEKNGFVLSEKKNLNDNGFICTIFVFEKK